MTEHRYVFNNAVTAKTSMRFAGLKATFDPSPIQYLSGIGVTDRWTCWELGAGGGSIARWLAERAGLPVTCSTANDGPGQRAALRSRLTSADA